MKAGSLVYCKRTYGDAYLKGKKYEIRGADQNGYWVSNDEYGENWLFIYNEIICEDRYRLNAKFNNYFYSVKEERRKKLEQIEKKS